MKRFLNFALTAALALSSIQMAKADLDLFKGEAEVKITGTVPEERVTLSSTEHHTRYETREVPDTCWRREFDGYRQECRPVTRRVCDSRPICRTVPDQVCRTAPNGQQICRDIPRRECSSESFCRDVWDQVCHQEAVYRDVPYSCTKTVSVPVGEENDYTVTANVLVKIDPVPDGIVADEALKLRLDETNLSLSASATSNRLLLFVKKDLASRIVKEKSGSEPGEKLIEATYTITPISREAVVSGIAGGVQGVALNPNAVTFTLGKVLAPEALAVQLTLKKNRSIGSDEDVFEGAINKDDLTLVDQGNRTQVQINLARLALKKAVKGGNSYWVTVRASISNVGGGGKELLNPSAIPAGGAAELRIQIKVAK